MLRCSLALVAELNVALHGSRLAGCVKETIYTWGKQREREQVDVSGCVCEFVKSIWMWYMFTFKLLLLLLLIFFTFTYLFMFLVLSGAGVQLDGNQMEVIQSEVKWEVMVASANDYVPPCQTFTLADEQNITLGREWVCAALVIQKYCMWTGTLWRRIFFCCNDGESTLVRKE